MQILNDTGPLAVVLHQSVVASPIRHRRVELFSMLVVEECPRLAQQRTHHVPEVDHRPSATGPRQFQQLFPTQRDF